MQNSHYYSSSINGPAAGTPYFHILFLINASHMYSWSRQELLAGGGWHGFTITTRIISGNLYCKYECSLNIIV